MKALRFGQHYRERKRLGDGNTLLLRLVRPSDARLLVDGFERLSPESRYRRFFGYKKSLSPAEVKYFTNCDGTNHFAIAALIERPDGSEEGVGVARFVRLSADPRAAEAAVTIIDDCQHHGLGRLLVDRLLSAATERGLVELQFAVLTTNQPMLALLRKLGLAHQPQRDSQFGRGVIKLVVPVPSQRDARAAL